MKPDRNEHPIESHKDQFPFLIITSLVISFLLIIIGLLLYQNSLLKKQIQTPVSSPAVVIIPTPTPVISDLTASWKTYTNNKYGFLVKYNPVFSPEETAGSVQQLALISFGMMKNNGYDIEISTGDNIGYYKNRITDLNGSQIDTEEKISVDGTPATKLTYKQVIVIEKFDVSQVIVTKNNYDYIITALSSDIDQILSTFKFD